MHATRSPSSISATPPGDVLDLSLSGSRLSFSKRPGGGAGMLPAGKFLARSVSVSAPCEARGKRNTLGDGVGSPRSVKNLRRSNSTTHVSQQAHFALSPDHHSGDYLTVLNSGADGRKKPDGTTWNVLDEQPRAPAALPVGRSSAGADSPSGMKRRDPAASFTANNRSNKGAVGNAVTTILHNNHGDKPLTPKSSNQRPPFNNLLKASANDDVSLENSSLTKSQKNFSSTSSNNKSPVPRASPPPQRCNQVSEEEAERYIQQVNQAAVTIQRWFRRHARRRRANRVALRRILDSKRKEWQERAEAESHLEMPRDDRKLIREEKARQARLAAIQELQQKRAQHHPPQAPQLQGPEADVENRRASGMAPGKKPAKILPSSASPTNTASVSPTHAKANNTDFHANVAADLSEVSFRVVSPALTNHRASPCAQERNGVAEEDDGDDGESIRQATPGLSRLAVPEPKLCDDLQPPAQGKPESGRPSSSARLPLSARSPPSPRNVSPVSAADVKAKNAPFGRRLPAEFAELSCFRAVSPSLSSRGGSRCSQEHPRRRLSGEDRSCAASKSTLNDLLDTIKLLEEEPEHFSEPKCYNKDKYAWLDPDGDADSLTADNLERHIQLSLPPPLPPDGDGAALLSEAKLQSIMNFLDEMEKSEQERPRSTASHREAAFLEEEVAPALDPASATAAQVSGSIMRIKMELEEKKRLVEMLQNALAQQRELTVQHVKETEKELSRNLQLQRDQYEATVQRHLTFIDQLIGDKKALSERCEGAIAELKLVDHKYTKKISQMQEQHEMEIKKLKELMSVTEKIRREKWIDEKTKKIKEITVKGLEPDIQKLISKHKQELKKLRTLHEAELLHAHEQGAERCARQCEELRRQLENEKEEQCRRERDLARRKFEKQLQEEELSLQQHRKRIHKEVADEKERLAQLAARQHSEMEELRRRMEENSCMAGRVFREELDKTREEQERRHQAELTKLQERFDQEKMSWEEEYRKKQEAGLLRHERQLREELRQERDKEIQLAIWTLEEETSKDKEESERAAQNRVNRVREAYEVELKELERSLRESLDKQQELRKHHMDAVQQVDALKDALRRKEEDLLIVTQNRDQLLEERHGLASVIQQEFDARLLLAEEEAQRARVEAEEVRVTLQAEVDRISKEKEDELHEVHQRVKAAILKKDEAVNALRRQHEAALKRAEHLEALWEEQRRQLMEK
ncbi:centrosomal protein of 131 kDa isoform X2 [Hippocampus comes]|uniref:centrosomal protein of 131 kDa isoform X2 n=1 Tax=Hippocampus comes TaxID=109280 RepID=UPI00094E31DB|nr:PREDICTED: centrosomal protein of 131 kDa isoform X2 [Hippocampus comes]